MQIENILSPELCLLGGEASSRKKALQISGQMFHDKNEQLDSFQIMKSFISREQLGSTAIGNGVALPHGRLDSCNEPLAAIIVLKEGVDFAAADTELVDILFCLLVPTEQDFSKIIGLSRIQKIFSDKIFRAQIRNAHNNKALYEIMNEALKDQRRESHS